MHHSRLSISFIQLLLICSLLTGCGSGGGGSSSGQDNEGSNIRIAKNISPDSNDSFNPEITADTAGNVYVAWKKDGGSSGTRIFLSKSINSGDSFDKAKDIKLYCSSLGDLSRDVNLITGGYGHTYLAWAEEWPTLNNVSDIRFFSEKNYSCGSLSNTFSSKESVYSPMIELNADKNVHMVWAQGKNGSPKEIFYKQNPQKTPVNISNTPESDSSDPLIGFDGSSTVNAAWVEQAAKSVTREIRFARSTDGGNNFYYSDSISEAGVDSYCPALATYSDNNIYVAYKGDQSIYFTKWSFTFFPEIRYYFAPPEEISTGSQSPSCPAILTDSNGTVYVVWEDDGEIWFSVSSDSGLSFSPPENVSQTENSSSSSPRIATNGPHLNIVWVEEDIGKGDIFIADYTDNGKTLFKRENLSRSPNIPSLLPSIASDKNEHVYVVWEEGEPGNRHIYLRGVVG